MLLIGTSERKIFDEQAEFTAQTIGEQVRSRRIENGLSLEAAASILGFEVAQLKAVENGTARLTPAQIVDLCPIL